MLKFCLIKTTFRQRYLIVKVKIVFLRSCDAYLKQRTPSTYNTSNMITFGSKLGNDGHTIFNIISFRSHYSKVCIWIVIEMKVHNNKGKIHKYLNGPFWGQELDMYESWKDKTIRTLAGMKQQSQHHVAVNVCKPLLPSSFPLRDVAARVRYFSILMLSSCLCVKGLLVAKQRTISSAVSLSILASFQMVPQLVSTKGL